MHREFCAVNFGSPGPLSANIFNMKSGTNCLSFQILYLVRIILIFFQHMEELIN